MKKPLVLLGVVVAALAAWHYLQNPLSARVKIRNQVFYVDLAVTPPERERGLSGRESLAPNRGMLFLFGSPGVYHFWMRGMKFPLDFIWIKEYTVVDIDTNVPPPAEGAEPIELAPDIAVDKVLEVASGTVQTYGIQVGDRVEYPNK